MPGDDLRFGDISGGGGDGVGGIINLVINLIILALVLYAFYKVLVTILPLL